MSRFAMGFRQAFWTWALIAVLVVLFTAIGVYLSSAQAALPWPCEMIRRYAGIYSENELKALAKDFKLSREQMAEAKRCLKEKKK